MIIYTEDRTVPNHTNLLLIVVGDGLPFDDGYEHRLAQEDCHVALSEAVSAGVGCACISVNPSTDDEILNRVWGHIPNIKLAAVTELASHVSPVFKRGLREAALAGRDGRRANHVVLTRDESVG